jgi:hypothetical protein
MSLNTYTRLTCYALFFGLIITLFPTKNFAQCDPLANDAPKNGVDADCDGLDDLYLHMPSYIYMVEGKKFEIFFRNLFVSNHISTYTIGVITTLQGAQTADTWSITPTLAMAGEHPFTIQVKDANGKIYASASSIIRIAPAQTHSSVAAKKLIVLGHSLVDQGIMPFYLRQLTDETGNPAITHYGTRISWSDFTTRHEGKGGSSWKYFGKEPESPLLKDSVLNIRNYLNTVICDNCNPDYLVIQLDINDFLVQGALDGTTQQEARDYIETIYQADILPIINGIRTTSPNTKIAICYTPPANDRPGVFLNHFGPVSVLNDTFRWKKITNTIYEKYTQYFAGREDENIYLIPIHLGVDNQNHYDDIDPFHPYPEGTQNSGANGYSPIARYIYAWIKNMMNTGVYNACNLNVEVKNIQSSANNTFDNSADDTFTYALNVNGFNAGAEWKATVNSQSITGTMGTDKPMAAVSTSNPLVFEVAAANNTLCKTKVVVSAAQCSNGTPVKTDLQMIVTSSSTQPSLFTNFKVYYTVKNNSSVAAEGVWVKVAKPTPDYAFFNNNPSTVSQGYFEYFYSSLWEVGKIPPNGTAVLTVDYYLLLPTIFPIYAQVFATVQPDIDSKPANGNGSTPIEDDEGAVIIGQNACLGDITPPTISCPANVYMITANSSANALWNSPTVTDNCANPVTLTSTFISGASFPLGATIVSYTAKDAANNTAKCTFTVNVTQQPVGGGNFACAGNVLQNADFNNNLTYWEGSGGAIATDAVAGTKFMNMCTAGTSMRQTISALPNQIYRLNWKGKTNTSNEKLGVMLKFLSNTWQILGTEYIDFNNVGSFGPGGLQKLSPAGTVWLEVSFIKNSTGCVSIDEVCLTNSTAPPAPPTDANCNAISDLPWEEWISSVRIGNVTKNSAKSVYSNTVTTPFSLNKSTTNSITLQSSWSYFTFDEYWRVWIDYNHDNIFQTNEKAYEGIITKPADGTTSKSLSSVISIPATALTGAAKMRVIMRRGAYPNPCGNIPQGEVEDFMVNISQSLTLGTARADEQVIEVADFTLYPNPATNEVNMQIQNVATTATAKLINQYGKTVRIFDLTNIKDNTINLNLEGVTNGIYFVEMTTPGLRKMTKKLVISKMD